MTFTVDLQDFRRALLSVLPHVAPAEQDQPALHRIRCELHRGGVLTLSASNGRHVGAAVASVLDGDDLLPHARGVFDLTPDAAAKLLAIHKPPKKRGGDLDMPPEQTLLVDVGDESLTTTDISGLFPVGEALTLPLAEPTDRVPDLLGVLSTYMGSRPFPNQEAPQLVLSPDAFAAFLVACKTYKAPMVQRLLDTPTGARAVVTVGDSFIGGFMAARVDPAQSVPDWQVAAAAWDAWEVRLPASVRWSSDDRDPAQADLGDDVDDLGEVDVDVDEAGVVHLSPVT